MKKIFLVSFMCLVLALTSLTCFAEEEKINDFGDWVRVFPDSGFPLEKTDNGLSISMTQGFAAAFSSKEKADIEGFVAEFTMNEWPNFDGKGGLGLWYLIGLEDEKILKNESTWVFEATGFFVLALPKDEDTTAFAIRYKVPGEKLKEPPVVTLNIAPSEKMKLEVKNNEILINGNSLSSDKELVAKISDLLNGKAHPTIAVFNSAPQYKPTTMTVQKIGGISYTKNTTKEPAKKTQNPITGDVGVCSFIILAGLSAASGTVMLRKNIFNR